MLVAIFCTDNTNALEIRLANRPAHLDHLKSLGDRLKFAGPTLDPDEKPNGSLIVIETQTLDQAETFAASDPYAKAGLFADVTIRPWVWALGTPAKPGTPTKPE